MKSKKKIAKKVGRETSDDEQNQISETKKRLKQQQSALKKIIKSFSKDKLNED